MEEEFAAIIVMIILRFLQILFNKKKNKLSKIEKEEYKTLQARLREAEILNTILRTDKDDLNKKLDQGRRDSIKATEEFKELHLKYMKLRKKKDNDVK